MVIDWQLPNFQVVDMTETLISLLNEALAPYRVQVETADVPGHMALEVLDEDGDSVLVRRVGTHQLLDRRLLTDVVDGLHRDLRIAEGRLQPCVIAALQGNPDGRGVDMRIS